MRACAKALLRLRNACSTQLTSSPADGFYPPDRVSSRAETGGAAARAGAYAVRGGRTAVEAHVPV